MGIENLAIGDKINYAEHPELFGDELTFEQLLGEPSSSLLIAWRSAFAGSTVEDVKQAVICRIVRVLDVDEDDPFTATVMLDSGERSPFSIEYDDMEETEPMDEEREKQHIWNLYDRIWKVKQEDKTVENIEHTEPEQAAEIALTEKQQAEALHKQITSYGEVVYQSLYGMCTAIKQMRDSKLYKALGFDTFEGYTEDKLGLKRRQAYKYISIAENLAGDFVHSSAQIGIQKLYLLAMVPEEVRTEIVQNTDLNSATVRLLQNQIESLKCAKNDMERARADAEKRAKKWYERASEEKQKGEEMLADCKRYWNGRAHEMEARIKELEQRPVDVAMDETAADRIKALNEELMQKKAEAAIARVRADAKAQEAADAVRAEYEQKIAEMQAQKQETKPDSALVFEAFMANAVKSIELLVDFLSAYKDDEKHPQFVAEFDAFMARVADEVAGV